MFPLTREVIAKAVDVSITEDHLGGPALGERYEAADLQYLQFCVLAVWYFMPEAEAAGLDLGAMYADALGKAEDDRFRQEYQRRLVLIEALQEVGSTSSEAEARQVVIDTIGFLPLEHMTTSECLRAINGALSREIDQSAPPTMAEIAARFEHQEVKEVLETMPYPSLRLLFRSIVEPPPMLDL